MTTNHPAVQKMADRRSADSTSVHPQETNQQFDNTSGYRGFLVSGMKPLIYKVQNLYSKLDLEERKNRVLPYSQCRANAWFVRHKVSKQIRVASQRCNLRWCPLCIRTKRYVMKQSIKPWIDSKKKPKFITLTLKHSEDCLQVQIDRIYAAVRKLRNCKLWKSHILGGMWFFQITQTKSGQWHPHIHIICEGKYIPQKDLSKKWESITSDSTIVDVRAIKSSKKTADYVARYATSPGNLSDLDEESALELMRALSGRRICGTFGSGKEIQLVPKKCPDADEWEDLGSFWQLRNRRHFDNFAAAIFFAWSTKTPCSIDLPDKESPPPNVRKEIMDYEPQTFKQSVFDWTNFYPERPNDDIPI